MALTATASILTHPAPVLTTASSSATPLAGNPAESGPGAHWRHDDPWALAMITFLTLAVAVEAVAFLCVFLALRSANNRVVLSIDLLTTRQDEDLSGLAALHQSVALLNEMQKLDRKRLDEIEFELREPIAAQAALMGLDPARYVRHREAGSADSLGSAGATEDSGKTLSIKLPSSPP